MSPREGVAMGSIMSPRRGVVMDRYRKPGKSLVYFLFWHYEG